MLKAMDIYPSMCTKTIDRAGQKIYSDIYVAACFLSNTSKKHIKEYVDVIFRI